MHVRKYTVLGGDLRNIKLAELISADGNLVNIYGFNNWGGELVPVNCTNLQSAVDDSEIVVGPLPCSNDSETINAPFHSEKIYVNEMLKTIKKNQLFIAGRIDEKILNMARAYNVFTIDILEREEMAVLNSIPTAEGAIQIAMEELPIALNGSKAMVLGYGRVGRVLAKMLDGIGANTYVAARKYSDLAWIKANGLRPVILDDIKQYVSSMDVIFNTIPFRVIDVPILGYIRTDCIIIDLASKPGGVDQRKAELLGIKTIWALSLPGKVAPVSAAGYLKQTIYNIIDELGV